MLINLYNFYKVRDVHIAWRTGREFKEGLDHMVQSLQEKGYESTPYKDWLW